MPQEVCVCVCGEGGDVGILDYSDNNKTILTKPALYGFLLWKDYRLKIITTYRESKTCKIWSHFLHLKLDKVKYGLKVLMFSGTPITFQGCIIFLKKNNNKIFDDLGKKTFISPWKFIYFPPFALREKIPKKIMLRFTSERNNDFSRNFTTLLCYIYLYNLNYN